MRQILLACVLALPWAGRAAAEPSGDATEAAFYQGLSDGRSVMFRDFKGFKEKLASEGASAVSWRRARPVKAVNEASSWEEILWAGLRPDFPQVQFGYGALVPVSSLCVDGAALRPLEPEIDHCSQWHQDGSCLQTQRVYLSTPIEGTWRECVRRDTSNPDQECLEWAVRPGRHALSYLVGVRSGQATNEGGTDNEVLFRKSLDIPACTGK